MTKGRFLNLVARAQVYDAALDAYISSNGVRVYLLRSPLVDMMTTPSVRISNPRHKKITQKNRRIQTRLTKRNYCNYMFYSRKIIYLHHIYQLGSCFFFVFFVFLFHCRIHTRRVHKLYE